MIVGFISDPDVRAGLVRAGHPDEDVVLDRGLADEALTSGYPRLVVCAGAAGRCAIGSRADLNVPIRAISRATLARWEEERRGLRLPMGRVDWLGHRLRDLVEREAGESSWVDRTLGELGRAAGTPLPPQLRGFARRVMEFPSHYNDLHPLAEACGFTRGALKARFRRRGLPSPSTYLRWFRLMSVAYALSDRSATVAQVANRLGYTSDGNLCRAMLALTRMTTSEVRSLPGWNRLLISFAWTHLGSTELEAWREMDGLFAARAA